MIYSKSQLNDRDPTAGMVAASAVLAEFNGVSEHYASDFLEVRYAKFSVRCFPRTAVHESSWEQRNRSDRAKRMKKEDSRLEVTTHEGKPTKFYNLVQEPPTVYVDTWQPTVTSSDVKIKLGDITERTEDEQVARLAFTIAMTHGSFLGLVAVLNEVAEFLKTTYGTEAASPFGITPEQFSEFAAKLGPES